MSTVKLSRAAKIDYVCKAGDTFAPGPVSFTIDSTPESFAGCTLKMQIKNGEITVHTLTNGSGITVSTNTLQYLISAADMAEKLPVSTYQYDVQKTDGAGIISTIQEGSIRVEQDVTT